MIDKKEYLRNWRKKNPKRARELNNRWFKTKKGKQCHIKQFVKYAKKLNWILLCPNPFDDSVSVDYHHILGAYVVAIPRELHQLYCGEHHRENLRPILEQIYLGDIE